MYLNTLPRDARQLLRDLGRESLNGSFYLAGGSAAAVHLGHRVSNCLVFFAARHKYEAELLTQQLRAIGPLTIQQQSRGILAGSLNGVRVSFSLYPHPTLAEMAVLEGVPVAHLLDIALMLLSAIGRGGGKRDFIDLYFICQHGYRLDDLLRRVPYKYGSPSYSSQDLVRALVYFVDAEGDETPRMLAPFDWGDVKEFFEGEALRLTQ
jgi:hypothetical protein